MNKTWIVGKRSHLKLQPNSPLNLVIKSELEFNESETHLKSAKNGFKLSAGLNLETLNKILTGTTIFNPWLKFFKLGLKLRKVRY